MKKLLFVVALGTASLLSASKKDNHVKNIGKNPQTKKMQTKTPKEFTCTTFKTSCGWTSGVCGKSLQELLVNMWEADNIICG